MFSEVVKEHRIVGKPRRNAENVSTREAEYSREERRRIGRFSLKK
jgi:hypothetical protein